MRPGSLLPPSPKATLGYKGNSDFGLAGLKTFIDIFGNLFAWKIAEAVEIPDYGSILTVRLDETLWLDRQWMLAAQKLDAALTFKPISEGPEASCKHMLAIIAGLTEGLNACSLCFPIFLWY
jgi:hypothetical protein